MGEVSLCGRLLLCYGSGGSNGANGMDLPVVGEDAGGDDEGCHCFGGFEFWEIGCFAGLGVLGGWELWSNVREIEV